LSVDPKNQIFKSNPLVLQAQSEPADGDLANGQFAIFPKSVGGKTELAIKGKDASGIVQPTAQLTQGGGQAPPTDTNGTYNTFSYTLVPGDITAKGFALSPAPKFPGQVELQAVGGLEQVNGTDFTVSGSMLSWDSLGLEPDVATGDEFIISYFS
jgi:hypothetical protein